MEFTQINLLKLELFLCLSIFYAQANAQFVNAPSASGFIRTQNVPVSQYTGIPQISVPLMTLSEPNGTKLQIGLSYHAGGIKVQDIAGPVGLGWNLVAGGMITREVRGLPDEEGNYYDPNASIRDQVHDVYYNVRDGEHDVFHYHFPGSSGTFVLDKDGQSVVQLPYTDKLIEKVGSLATGTWKITDEAGNQYFFGDLEQKETTNVQTLENGSQIDVKNYVSSWYLNRIDLVSGGRITFDYLPGSNYSFSTKSTSVSRETCGGNATAVTLTNTEYVTEIQNPKYLLSITSDLGFIDFHWADDRKEIGMKYLQSISLYDFNVTELSKYNFEYFYFDASDAYENGIPYGIQESCTDEICKRLGLKAIKRVSPNGSSILFREFEYLDNRIEGTYSYDVYELPPRNSRHIDHWGYSNGSASENIHGTKLPFLWNDDLRGIPNLSLKNAHPDFTKANMLYQIKDENEGLTKLSYELNENSTGNFVGGLRIRSVELKKSEDDLNPLVETFIYTDGYSFSSPDYELAYSVNSCDNSIINSTSSTSLFDFNGPNIGYGKVERVISNGSVITSEFHDINDHPDIDAIYPTLGSVFPVSTYPQNSPNTTRFWERGVPSTIETMVPGSTTNVETTKAFIYNEDLSIESTVENIQVVGYLGVDDHVYASYAYNSVPYTINQQSESYADFSSGSRVWTTNGSNFSYHNEFKTLPNRITTELTDGLINESIYRYPSDYDLSTIALDAVAEVVGHKYLIDNHIINVPIETEIHYGEAGSLRMISGQFQTYRSYGTFVQPYKSYRLDISDPITDYARVTLATTQNAFDRDPRLRLVQSLNFNTSGRLQSESGESGITTNYTWNASNTLLEEVSVNSRSTNYNQLPLIGLQSGTDPNGNTISYEYDVFNRLRLIRDQDNDIVERYRYHYKSEDFGANAALGCYGLLEAGEAITFTAENGGASSGETSFIWDLGDGNVLETTTPSIAYTYAAPGLYPISLTLVNPEYDPVHIAKTINIHGTPIVTPGAPFEVETFITVDGSPTNEICIEQDYTGFLTFETSLTGTTCSPLNYYWQRSINGGAFEDFSGGASAIPPSDWFSTATGANSIVVSVIVVDDCNYIVSADTPITITVSGSCPQP